MGVFLAVHSNNNMVSSCLEPEKLSIYDDALHIEYNNRTIAKSNNGQFAFVHYERRDAFYSAEDQTHITRKNKSLVVTFLQGYLWEKRCDTDILAAKQLQKMLYTSGCEEVRDRCNGEYSVIHYDESKNTLIVFNDRVAVEPLYYYKDNDKVIISNRVRLISKVLQKSSPDVENLNWIIAVGIIIGEGTSEKKILRVPQGAYLSILNNKTRIHENNVFMIDKEFNKELRDSSKFRIFPFIRSKKLSVDDILDSSIKECAVNVQTCLEHSPETLIPLSGGKDSRAVLALATYFDKNRRINAYTVGFDEHADVVVAKQISRLLNIDLKVITPKPPAEVTDDWVYNRMKGHVFQTDGLHGAWDAKGYTVPAGGISLSGHIGEIYRCNYNYNKSLDLSSIDKAAKLFHSLNSFDRSGLLTPAARDHYEIKLKERVSFYLDNGAKLVDVPDIIYSMERIPNWVGSLRRIDGYSSRLVNPLNTENLMKLAFYLGDEQRRIERIHFELINRLIPSLTSQKFADDRWNSELEKYANGSQLATSMVETPPNMPRFGSWQYRLNDSESLRNRMLDVFTSYSQSPMWDFCDKKIVEEKFKKGSFETTFELLGAYGFINAFFYTHKIESPMKLRTIPE